MSLRFLEDPKPQLTEEISSVLLFFFFLLFLFEVANLFSSLDDDLILNGNVPIDRLCAL